MVGEGDQLWACSSQLKGRLGGEGDTDWIGPLSDPALGFDGEAQEKAPGLSTQCPSVVLSPKGH